MDTQEIRRIVSEIMAKGMKQREIAARIGVEQQAISAWKVGVVKISPKQENIDKLLELYEDVTGNELARPEDILVPGEDLTPMMSVVMASGSYLNRLAMAASLKALYKATIGEVEMSDMRERMTRLEEQLMVLPRMEETMNRLSEMFSNGGQHIKRETSLS